MKLINKWLRPKKYGWFGNYNSWQEASALTEGYNKTNILDKTKAALLKVKNGEAVYERDTVLFDKKEYPYPLITYLLQQGRALNILDFGGSLGTTYYQVRDFVTPGSWHIVEQAHYVNCGKELFENDILKFHYSIADCLASTPIDVVILSSVLQFLPDPHTFLHSLVQYGFERIIIDRTFFTNGTHDRLTVQHVWPSVYEASYPAWFFEEQKFLLHFKNEYTLLGEFPPYVAAEAIVQIDEKPAGYSKGFCFVKNQDK